MVVSQTEFSMSPNRPRPSKYKHNDLFRPDPGRPFLNACVGTNGGPYNLQDYSMGYFRAGERLVRSILQDSTLLDLNIYPLVFTYRHAIELGLKSLAQILPRMQSQNSSAKLTHKLLDNWAVVRGYLEQGSELDHDPIESVDRILKDFVEIDPSGEAFRFPHARDGAPFLQESSHINIAVFAEAMKHVQEALEYWQEAALEILQTRAEAGDAG